MKERKVVIQSYQYGSNKKPEFDLWEGGEL